MDLGPIQHVRMVRAFLDRGRTLEAMVICKKGLRVFPEHAELHLALADTYRARRDAEREAEQLAHVRRLAPEHPGLRERPLLPPAPSRWRRFVGL